MGSTATFVEKKLPGEIWMVQGNSPDQWLICTEWQVEMVRHLNEIDPFHPKRKHDPTTDTTVEAIVNGYTYEMYYEAIYPMFQHSEIILHNIHTGKKRLLFQATMYAPAHLGATGSLTYSLTGHGGTHIKEKILRN